MDEHSGRSSIEIAGDAAVAVYRGTRLLSLWHISYLSERSVTIDPHHRCKVYDTVT